MEEGHTANDTSLQVVRERRAGRIRWAPGESYYERRKVNLACNLFAVSAVSLFLVESRSAVVEEFFERCSIRHGS